MDQATMEAVQAFLRVWEVKGGMFPWIPLTMAVGGCVLFSIAVWIYYKYVQPHGDDAEGLQAICVGLGVLGAVMFIVCGLSTASYLYEYILWTRDPKVFALQKLIRALRY